MERRHTTRYNFGAIAEVIDLGSRTEFVAITRNLSLSGCFIKTRTPLAEGAEIRVRITSSGEDFAAIGKVTRNVTPVGMGIEFLRLRRAIERVANIAGNEMSCFPFDSGKDDRSILIGQRNRLREVARRCVEELNASAQSRQPASVNVIGKVDSRFSKA
jgi:hypothetical protein